MSVFETQNIIRKTLAYFLLALVPYGFYGVVRLFLIRKTDLVRARMPLLSLSISCVLLVYVVFKGLSLVLEDAPCSGLAFITTFALHGFATTGYFLRAFVLWFRIELANDSILYWKKNIDEQIDHESTFWFQRHRYLISPLNLKIFFVVSNFFFVVLAILSSTHQTNDDFIPDQGDNCPYSPWAFVSLILAFAFGVGILLLSFKLRKGLDAFGIKNELQYTGWPCLCLLIVFIVVAETDTFDTPRIQANALVTIIGSLVPVYVSTWYVLTLQRRFTDSPTKDSRVSAASIGSRSDNELLAMIERPDGFEVFKSYLATEFAVENALFWRDSLSLMNLFAYAIEEASEEMFKNSKVEFEQRLLLIISTYFDDEGPLSINISGSLRERGKNLKTDLEKQGLSLEYLELAHEVLTLAHNQIFKTMYEDSWRRFKQSAAFTAWKEQEQNQLENRIVMKELI